MKLNKKVCVVGAGYWGKNHIRTLFELDALGGIVDENLDTIEKFKFKYTDVIFFSNLEDAINSDKFSGFVVATPAETHYEIALKIIDKGYHILIEKPVTLKLEDAIHLKKISEFNNVNLMAGHIMLFHPAIQKIKEILDTGQLGDLQYIYSNRLNLGAIRNKENVFWSLAPHDISIFQYLTNSIPKNIISTGGIFLQEGIHDTTLTILEYENNIKSHIFVSWLHPFKEHRLMVIGSQGMISFEDSSIDKSLKLYLKGFDMSKGIPDKNDGPIKLIPYDKGLPLTKELEYFIDHLNGKPLKISNAQNAVDVVKILVASSNSLNNGIKNA